MPKTVVAPASAEKGAPPRLFSGNWQDVCKCVAAELERAGAGKFPTEATPKPATAAVLMFSTSERSSKFNPNPAAAALRTALMARGLRAYNPRNKTAARNESPVAELLGLLSYLIDPVSQARIGKNGRSTLVWASCREEDKARHAISAPPPFFVSDAHKNFQNAFMKTDGGKIGSPAGNRVEIVTFLDKIRENLVNAQGKGQEPRLSLAGLIARILSFARYRGAGYSQDLFRQAMFTSLLEANVAPTRLSRRSLDLPMKPTRTKDKIVWPDQFWSFLNIMGALLSNTSLDDEEVEAFAENSIVLMTFHQAKGLEFDHVYVAASGREAQVQSVLQTMLFSGRAPRYKVTSNQVTTKDRSVLDLAEADRDREVYVALTRARRQLTILFDPSDGRHGRSRSRPSFGARC